MPFGFLLPFRFRNINSLQKGCLIGMSLSTTIEFIQLFMPDRWTDIDDIILNTIGAGIGYCLFELSNKFYKTKQRNEEG
jgi:glycopeptide antibiotics resistance protein